MPSRSEKEGLQMARYYQYTKGNKQYWAFQAYIGTDARTGKRIRVNRRQDRDGNPFTKRSQCELEVARLKVDVENGDYFLSSNQTFKGLYEEWIERRYKSTVEDSTLSNTKRKFNLHILPYFGNKKVDGITKYDCESFIEELDFKTQKTVKLICTYVSRVFEYGIHIEIIKKNPMEQAYIPKKKTPPKQPTPYFDRYELKEFLDCAKTYGYKEKWGMLFHFLAYTGCRKGEALALQWSDIDFENTTVSLTKTTSKNEEGLVVHETTKTGTHRTISLDPGTIEKLKHWKKQQAKDSLMMGYNTLNKEQLVFPDQENKYMASATVNRAMARIIQTHNLKHVPPHGLRHTHCSLLFEAMDMKDIEGSIKQVQNRLGHKDIKTTLDIYTHVTKEKEQETAMIFMDHMEK